MSLKTYSDPIEEENEVNPFPVSIFDATYCGEPVPAGFEAVRILIDGKLKADLSWKNEREAALAYVKQGLRIFWEIDLGLLNGSLSNRTQFLSLSLSLEHFCKSLWKEFRKETVGLCFFRGSLDLSKDFPWDEEQAANLQEWKSEHGQDIPLSYFCRDVFSEYAHLLVASVPDNLPLFLLLDASEIVDPYVEAHLLNKEYFSRFHIAVKTQSINELGGELAWEGIAKEKGVIAREIKNHQQHERAQLAVCLPNKPDSIALQKVFKDLHNHHVTFRVIPEGKLAIEWDGLDDLIVDSTCISYQFKRKLQGFCAAGGRVVFTGTSIDLAEEIPFNVLLSESQDKQDL